MTGRGKLDDGIAGQASHRTSVGTSGDPEQGRTFLHSKSRPARAGQRLSGPAELLRRRVDLDDMFGLRRALSSLPERFHDIFVERWVQLGGHCDYDVNALSVETRNESDHWRRRGR